jgi:hypothetical protein
LRRIKIPLVLGNGVEILGIAVAIYLVLKAPQVGDIFLRFFLYLISWGCLEFFPHCLAHFVVGRLVGAGFAHYFFGKSSITRLRSRVLNAVASAVPVLTLKIDQNSLRSVTHGGRAALYASGAAASMILPFFVAVASLGRLPIGLSVVLLLLSAGNVAFDLYYSPKVGDISRI